MMTKLDRNVKNQLMGMNDKLWLRKRRLIEKVNDQLKNIIKIGHAMHLQPNKLSGKPPEWAITIANSSRSLLLPQMFNPSSSKFRPKFRPSI
jgi:Transposase DDE domain